MDMQLQLGDLEMSNDDSARLKFTDIENWNSSAPNRVTKDDRARSDVSFDPGESFRAGKQMSVVGWTRGVSDLDELELIDDLNAFASDGLKQLIAVTDAAGQRWAEVYLDGIVSVVPYTARRAQFRIPLWAPDPRKYGAVHTVSAPLSAPRAGGLHFPLFTNTRGARSGVLDFGGDKTSPEVTAVNNGRAPSWPVVRAYGNLSGGIQITERTTGAVIRYVDPIPAGAYVEFDSATGSALYNGEVDVAGGVARFDKVPVPGRSQLVFRGSPIGPFGSGATLQAESKDAWW